MSRCREGLLNPQGGVGESWIRVCSMGQVQGTGRTVERGEGALKPEQLSVQRAQREERRHTRWPPTGAISHLDFHGLPSNIQDLSWRLLTPTWPIIKYSVPCHLYVS